MGNEPSATARPRGGRRLIVAGGIIASAALIVGVTSAAVVARSVGGPMSEAFTSPSRPTPVDEELSLNAGRYTVFELVGRRSSQGPVTTTKSTASTVTPETIEVTGPDGVTIPLDGFTSSSESLTRAQDIYAGVARFVVAESGQYRVQIKSPAGTHVVIAPAFGSGFGAVRNWAFAGITSFVAVVLGVVLVIVGAIRRRRPIDRSTQVTRPPGPDSGQPFRGSGPPVQDGGPPIQFTGPPKGWYRAPDVANRERYWDGRAWTDRLR